MALQPLAAGPSSNQAFACNSVSEPVFLRAHIFIQRGDFLRNLKGGDAHQIKRRPISGHIGSRWSIPRQGKHSVACDQACSGQKGLVSRDRTTQVGRNRYGISVGQKHLP